MLEYMSALLKAGAAIASNAIAAAPAQIHRVPAAVKPLRPSSAYRPASTNDAPAPRTAMAMPARSACTITGPSSWAIGSGSSCSQPRYGTWWCAAYATIASCAAKIATSSAVPDRAPMRGMRDAIPSPGLPRSKSRRVKPIT